jgi:hypothetical protein
MGSDGGFQSLKRLPLGEGGIGPLKGRRHRSGLTLGGAAGTQTLYIAVQSNITP